MTTDQSTEPEPAIGRRKLLHGGALLAGAASVAVAGAALGAPPAVAADGDNVILGQNNDADATTGIAIADPNGTDQPTLSLTNANGPSLYLNPLAEDWSGDLRPGEIANTVAGPLIGVSQGGQNLTTQLLTEQDVWLPFALPTPMRLVDTRTSDGRLRVVLPSPLAGDGRLPARRPMTFWIAPTGQGFGIPAVYLNLTVVRPLASGWAAMYPGPDRPGTSTINFQKGQTVANLAFTGTSIGTFTVKFGPDPASQVEVFAVTVYTTASAWIVIDATGAFATGFNPTEQQASTSRRATGRHPSPVVLAKRGMGKL